MYFTNKRTRLAVDSSIGTIDNLPEFKVLSQRSALDPKESNPKGGIKKLVSLKSPGPQACQMYL